MVKHPPINSDEYIYEFPERIAVLKYMKAGLWDVYSGFKLLREFSSHTEAINFAQKRARKVL